MIFDAAYMTQAAETPPQFLPKPAGYQLLVLLPKMAETFGASMIVRPDTTMKEEHQATMLGVVVAMGPDAYQDQDKFPHGPYCRVGDIVLFSTYAGTRIKIGGIDYRLMNDDTVKAVVEDPSKFQRG